MSAFSGQAIHDPRAMPELRAALLDFAEPGGAWGNAEQARTLRDMVGSISGKSGSDSNVIMGPRGFGREDLANALHVARFRAENALDWSRRTLADAQLYHVSEELCEILFSSEESVPHDTVLRSDMAPSPAGFVVFSEPFTGIDSDASNDAIRVDAIMWGPVKLPPREINWEVEDQFVLPGFAIATFRYAERGQPDLEDGELQRLGMSLTLPQWLPLGRSDWVLGDAIDTVPNTGIEAESATHQSMMEDRRLIAALWALIEQRKLVERTTVTAPRPAQKRLDRMGDTTSRDVVVIHLRREAHEFLPVNEDGSTGRKVGVRFYVRPFWRHQRFGRGRAESKLILIAGHWRGPDGAPLKNVERVFELDR